MVVGVIRTVGTRTWSSWGCFQKPGSELSMVANGGVLTSSMAINRADRPIIAVRSMGGTGGIRRILMFMLMQRVERLKPYGP